MANAKYVNTSPWYNTRMNKEYLDIFAIRPVSAQSDDYLYTVEPQYNYRPDLLAYDLYGTPKLWWVFVQRNMDIMQDGIFDCRTGVQIYLPKKSSLMKVLGL